MFSVHFCIWYTENPPCFYFRSTRPTPCEFTLRPRDHGPWRARRAFTLYSSVYFRLLFGAGESPPKKLTSPLNCTVLGSEFQRAGAANLASDEIILELVRTKCKLTPILLYGLECFQLGKADLNFTYNRLCVKLFKTGSIDVVKDCRSCFAIDLPSCVLKRRQHEFILRYISTVNGFCQFCNKLQYIIK